MKITLLGDSIRRSGYGQLVPNLLGKDFQVYQPEENCRFAKYTLRGLFDWQKDMNGSRIVHWNNGLWDTCDLFGDGLFTSESEYTENMLRIADFLISHYDRVIFATSTPVNEKNQYNKNSDIERYNSIIVPLLKEKGIVINDLYSLVASDIDKYIRKDDMIHLTDAGIKVCSEQVARIIIDVSKTLDNGDKNNDGCIISDDYSNGAPV